MRRVKEYEKEYKTNNVLGAINRFFEKYQDVDYWKDTFEYMLENGENFFCDNLMADGEVNKDWRYALHLVVDEKYVYICVIEREV